MVSSSSFIGKPATSEVGYRPLEEQPLPLDGATIHTTRLYTIINIQMRCCMLWRCYGGVQLLLLRMLNLKHKMFRIFQSSRLHQILCSRLDVFSISSCLYFVRCDVIKRSNDYHLKNTANWAKSTCLLSIIFIQKGSSITIGYTVYSFFKNITSQYCTSSVTYCKHILL